MPRQKEFDSDACLEQVMHLFWQKGFQATSMADLVKCSRVQRYGLYESFGGKQELFQCALRLYLDTIIKNRFAVFEHETRESPLESIKQFFGQFIEQLEHPNSSFGCLIINTAVSPEPPNDAVALIVQEYFERLRCGFRSALKAAKLKKEISVDADIAGLTDFLIGTVLGLTTYARSSLSRRNVQNYIRQSLAMLNHA